MQARGGPVASTPAPPALRRSHSARSCAPPPPSGTQTTRPLGRDACPAIAAGAGPGRDVRAAAAAEGGGGPPPPPTPAPPRNFVAIEQGGSRGVRDALQLSDYDSSDDGELYGSSSALPTSMKRLDVPYAVIQLADEVYARLVETDVSTADGPAKLAASLFGILPPPGYGSGPVDLETGAGHVASSDGRPPAGPPPPPRTSSANGPESWYDLEALGERDVVAMLRRLGRQAGTGVALAFHDLLDCAGAGYPTRTRAVYGVLAHVAMLNGDGPAMDTVWENMVAAGFPPDDEAYNQAICAYAKARDLDRAAALYASASASGVRLTDVTYSTLLSGLEKCVPYYDGFDPMPSPPPPGGRPPWMTDEGAAVVERVRALWADMRDAGVRPLTFTHRPIVASLARSGDLAGARAAAREHAAAQPSGSGLPPYVIGTHLTLGCLWLGDWAGARAGLADLAAGDPATSAGGADPGRLVSDALRAGGPDGFAFALDAARVLRPLFWAPGAPVTHGPARRGDGGPATDGALMAKQAGAAGDKQAAAPPPASRPNLRRLLGAAHELGRVEDARAIAAWAAEDGWRDALSVGLVARTLAAGGDVDGAVSYLRPFVDEGRDARFEPALSALIAVGDAADEAGRAEALAAALAGPLAPFAPPPGWHRGPAAAPAQGAPGPPPPASKASNAGPPPTSRATPFRGAAGRRLSGGRGRGGGGGSESGSDRDLPGRGGAGGSRRAPGPWGPQ